MIVDLKYLSVMSCHITRPHDSHETLIKRRKNETQTIEREKCWKIVSNLSILWYDYGIRQSVEVKVKFSYSCCDVLEKMCKNPELCHLHRCWVILCWKFHRFFVPSIAISSFIITISCDKISCLDRHKTWDIGRWKFKLFLRFWRRKWESVMKWLEKDRR